MRTAAEDVEAGKLGVLGWIAMAVIVVLTLFPVFWLISTSIKPLPEWIASPPVFITSTPTLNNYLILFDPSLVIAFQMSVGATSEPVLGAFKDSAIIAGLGTGLSIAIGILAALAISRHKFGGNFLPLFILSARMFPPVVVIIPLIILYSTLGLIDTHLGLILAYAVFTCPYSVWMMRSFIEEVPRELEDAAKIDGLSTLATYFRVTLPLVKGGMAATALFVLILNWSEFLFALTLTHSKVMTVPVQASKYFSGSVGTLYGIQAAIGVLAIIPILVLSYLIQKYLVVGLTFGAVKR